MRLSRLSWLVGSFVSSLFFFSFRTPFLCCVETLPPVISSLHSILLRVLPPFLLFFILPRFLCYSSTPTKNTHRGVAEMQDAESALSPAFLGNIYDNIEVRSEESHHPIHVARNNMPMNIFCCLSCHPIYNSLDVSLHLSVDNMLAHRPGSHSFFFSFFSVLHLHLAVVVLSHLFI